MPKSITMNTDCALSGDGLYRLMSWLTPGFPVGGYTFSHGIEFAVEEGLVTDGESLTIWLEGIIRFGAGRLDADFLRAGWQATKEKDDGLLAWAVERAAVQRATAETALESAAQGGAFMDAILAAWPDLGMERFHDLLDTMKRPPAYAVVVGVAAAGAGIPIAAALTAYLHAVAANLVSAAVRLVPLGQTDGQKTLAALQSVVAGEVRATIKRGFEDLGSAAPMVEWTSIKHETQYTRLFRS